MVANRDLAELLARASEKETAAHRRRALLRASRGAMFHWAEEAADLVRSGRSLTELPRVGPWTARIIQGWFEDPPEIPDPPPDRRGFLSRSEARAIVEANPEWRAAIRADLQVHTTYSDGSLPVPEMAEEVAGRGYEYMAVTDHSGGQRIPHGMDEAALARQALEIAVVNQRIEAEGREFCILHGMEMNLSPEGEGDARPDLLASLDLVLGAFHSNLRTSEDQTERYLAGLRNPTVHVLAHPRCRMYGRRLGLQADWRRVAEEAAATGKALEADATAHRQDLDAELLELARDAGAWVSIGTDAHYAFELDYVEFGLAACILAEVPRERILNFMPHEELLAWRRSLSVS